MIVYIIHIDRMTIVEAEYDAPIPGHRDRPKAGELSLERMQPQARKVHIIRATAAIEHRENVAQLFHMRGRQPSCRSPIVKGFEPTMFKRLDHNP